MKRRFFLGSAATSLSLLFLKPSSAFAVSESYSDSVVAESTFWFKFMHYHRLEIPLQALAAPPAEGIQLKTTVVDQSIYDPGLEEIGLSKHSHNVSVSAEQLEKIAKGEKEVLVNVYLKDGRVTHRFYFTAPGSVVSKVKKIRLASTS